MKTIDIDEVVQGAVQAALGVVDAAMDMTSNNSVSPAGDKLAGDLDRVIRAALVAHMQSDLAPAFVKAA